MLLFGLCGERERLDEQGRTKKNEVDDDNNNGNDNEEGNKGAPLKSGGFNNQHYAEVGEREATNDNDQYYNDAKTKTTRR